ncbi:hypothetical protein BGX23_006901 [Mortierella sp. AD031]|nr:hypothetical protein BGX23_006901 [Mortierella sp. AD031]
MSPMESSKYSIEQKKAVGKYFGQILYTPFQDKYEDKWDEEFFRASILEFEEKCKTELGFEGPIEEAFKEIGYMPYEELKTILKAGPPAFARPGWKSPMLGHKLEILEQLKGCEYVQGQEYKGVERIVLLDVWATWCGPCLEAAPKLSALAEKHAGVVAVIGVNNDGVFQTKPHDVEHVKKFLANEKVKDKFRYTVAVDLQNHVRDNVFKKCGFEGVPAGILFVDNVITFVGDIEEGVDLNVALDKALEAIGAAPALAAKEE